MKKSIILVFTIAFFACNNKETKNTKINNFDKHHAMIGDIINLSNYELNPNNGKSISQDKLILLDFWATWCGPCIASFPDIEDLQWKFKDKIQVIAISDESDEKISSFLEKKPYKLSFFNNKDRKLHKVFNVTTLPKYCLLTSEGKFIWIGNSKNLEKALEEYFKSGKIKPNESDASQYSDYYNAKKDEKVKEDYLYEYNIKPAGEKPFMATSGFRAKENPAYIYFQSASVTEVVNSLMEIDYSRFKNQREELDTILINVEMNSKSEDD